MNQLYLIGKAGKDAEFHQKDKGCYATFSVCVSEKREDPNQGTIYVPSWFRVVSFGRVAEQVGKQVKKGSDVFIHGKLTASSWEDREGKKRIEYGVTAFSVKVIDRFKAEGSSQGGMNELVQNANQGQNDFDDIPF